MTALPLAALIFDFDGTISETERDGHRVAYNLAFEDAGVDWRWDVATYGEMLAIAGGKERMSAYLARERPALAPEVREPLVARLHEAKQLRFNALAPALPFRRGVVRLVREAKSAGLRVAIATTAAPAGVDAVLARDPLFARDFDFIAAGDVVPRKKPAPDIYTYALDALGLRAEQCVAFEDSALGLRAARAAGLPTIVTPSTYTLGEDFRGAAAVLSDLGEPDSTAHALAGVPPPQRYVDLAYVRALRATAP